MPEPPAPTTKILVVISSFTIGSLASTAWLNPSVPPACSRQSLTASLMARLVIVAPVTVSTL